MPYGKREYSLYVPKNVEVEEPFQVAFVLEGEGNISLPRTLIVAEQSSSVNYIEESISHGAHGQALNVGVVEVYADNDAQVRYVDVQRWERMSITLMSNALLGRTTASSSGKPAN